MHVYVSKFVSIGSPSDAYVSPLGDTENLRVTTRDVRIKLTNGACMTVTTKVEYNYTMQNQRKITDHLKKDYA